MGLNPTILRQVRACALAVTPSEPPPVHRRGYRASGLVLTSIRAIRSRATNVRSGSGGRSGLWSFFDRVDAIRVEGQMVLDGHHCRVGRFIRPDGIGRTLVPERNTEIGAVTFIRAVRGMIGRLK